MEVEGRIKSPPWRWPLLLSLVLINVCLPSLVLSYGTLLLHASSNSLPVWLGLATPTIYIFTFYLTQCWCRDAADSWGGRAGYRVMAALGLLLVVVSLLLCAFVPFHIQPLVYGGLGGLGSSLMSAQVDAVIFDTYDMRLGIIRGLCYAGQAVGQAVFPHIITALVDFYGYSMAYVVLSAIMLQTLPAIMFLTVDEGIKRPASYSRYSDLARTYAQFDNDTVNSYYTNELQLNDLRRPKSWKSLGDDNLHYVDNHEEDDAEKNTATVTPPPSPEEKRRNIFGVEILPEIVEESEDSDDEIQSIKNKHRVSAAIQRLSSIGDSFDEYISKQISSNSLDGSINQAYSELSVTFDHVGPMTEIEREKILNSFSSRCHSAYLSFRRRLWMPSYRVYRFRRRIQYCFYSFNDTFIKPLTRSLSCWRFYPALLLSFARLCLMAVSLALLPLIDFQLSPAISMLETNFMISLHGFTWVCFLVATPWLASTPKRNYKYVAVVGLIVSSVAGFVIALMKHHDAFCIGCVVAGLGFGAVIFCWESAAQEFVGAQMWPKVHSTVESLSGICLAIYVGGLCYALKHEAIDLHLCILIVAATLAAVALVWFVISAVVFYRQELRFFRFKL